MILGFTCRKHDSGKEFLSTLNVIIYDDSFSEDEQEDPLIYNLIQQIDKYITEKYRSFALITLISN